MQEQVVIWLVAAVSLVLVAVSLVRAARKRAAEDRKREAKRAQRKTKAKNRAAAEKSDIGAKVRGASDKSIEQQSAIFEEMLERATRGLEGEVWRGASKKKVDLQWRGEIDGVSLRATCDGGRLEVQAALTAGPEDQFRIEFDPDAEYSAAAPAPFDGMDVVQLFLGPHVFVPTPAEFAEDTARYLDGLPDSLREQLVEVMPTQSLQTVLVLPDSVRLQHDGWVTDLPAAHKRARAWLELAPRIAVAVDRLEPASAPRVEGPLMVCEYCCAHFLLPGSGRCPSCGAPATRRAEADAPPT